MGEFAAGWYQPSAVKVMEESWTQTCSDLIVVQHLAAAAVVGFLAGSAIGLIDTDQQQSLLSNLFHSVEVLSAVINYNKLVRNRPLNID